MKDDLGARMKGNYEGRYRISLPRRTFTIIRLDGKSFHTYTKGLERPYDRELMRDMQMTAQYLCENIDGTVLAYTQSDEISLLLTDFGSTATEAWFDGNIQKMCSVSASLATAKFNSLRLHQKKLAMFDSRVFVIPDRQEVLNYFIWRQKDATRNSLQMLAQSLYSHKQLHGKGWSDLHEMIFQKGDNWAKYDTHVKRGAIIVRVPGKKTVTNDFVGTIEVDTNPFEIVLETPDFVKDRDTFGMYIPSQELQTYEPEIPEILTI